MPFSFSSFFRGVTRNAYPIELVLAFILSILIALFFGYILGYLINKCQNNSSSPQSSSATIPETSSIQPPQSETAIPPLHSTLPSKDMHASTSHAHSAIANTRTAATMNQSSIELTTTSEDRCKPERFYSSRGFISRFVDDYKVDSGEIGNSSTENAQSATTGEHIQLERYLSARGGVGDENEVENAVSAMGNTPTATGEHIELERFLSARGDVGDDIETDDYQNVGK